MRCECRLIFCSRGPCILLRRRRFACETSQHDDPDSAAAALAEATRDTFGPSSFPCNTSSDVVDCARPSANAYRLKDACHAPFQL